MKKEAQYRIIGDRNVYSKSLVLPDSCTELLKSYNFTLVEYKNFGCLGIYVQRSVEPEVDVVSHTVYKHHHGNNILDGFRQVIKEIKAVEHIEPESAQTTESNFPMKVESNEND